MNLFEYNHTKREKQNAPLASRIRPVILEDFVGQEHMIGKDKLLYRAIQSDRLSSIILYGPPGTGKTTLAKIIANKTESDFQQLNATTSGIKEMKEIIEHAKDTSGMYQKKQFYLLMKFIDLIKYNKMLYCLMWKMAPLY